MNYISFSYYNKAPIFIWKIHDDRVEKGAEIIDDNLELRLLINYPLNLPKLFIYTKSESKEIINGWTRNEVLNIISRTYKQIYKEELNTATIKHTRDRSFSVDNKPTSEIRPETNGIHGLHTYYLTELYITEMIYDFKKDYWHVCVSGSHH